MIARTFISAAILLLIAGCPADVAPPIPGPSNPASDAAMEAPLPPKSMTLAIDPATAPPKLEDPPMRSTPGMGNMNGMHHMEAMPSEQAVLYTCPMHAQVITDKPGKCPICGMNLIKKGNATTQPGKAPAQQHDSGSQQGGNK